MYEHDRTSLPNGLNLVTIPMPQLESTTVLVGVGAGSRFENNETKGLFHFLEHMAFKGTRRRPTALEIASEIDGVGGEFNAFTGKELTGYYVKVAAKHCRLAFDVLADILTESIFDLREIEKEKGVIVEEINMYEDNPSHKVLEEFVGLLYGDNPMGWSIAGTKASVRKIRRRHFLDYLGSYYSAGNMALVVAGKVDGKQTKEMAREYFKKLTGKKMPKAGQVNLNQKKAGSRVIYKKTEQAHFCLGVPGLSLAHPQRFALGVLSVALGGGMSSRLFTEIREKRGLAYYVGSTPDFFTDSGYLVVRAGVRLQAVDEALKVVLEELHRLVKVKVSEAELKKAKEYLKGHLILSMEDSGRVASRSATQLLLEKKIRTPKETLARIDRVNADDLQTVARELFQQKKMNLAIIGPYRSEARFTKIIDSFSQ